MKENKASTIVKLNRNKNKNASYSMNKGKHNLKVLNLHDELEESKNSSNNAEARRYNPMYGNANHMFIPTTQDENSCDSIVNNSQQQQDLEEGTYNEEIEESDYNFDNIVDDKILLPNKNSKNNLHHLHQNHPLNQVDLQ